MPSLPRLLKNVSYAYFVNILQLAFSLLSNLVIPAVASKSAYANYRILVLYAGFAGVLHFGLLNGLYLMVIGRSIEETDWQLLQKLRRALIVLQIGILPISYLILERVLPPQINGFVIVTIVICWGLANWITFHNFYFQGTNQFARFALANSVSFIVGIILLLIIIIGREAKAVYLELTFIMQLLITICVYEILWGNGVKLKFKKKPIENINEEGTMLFPIWRRGFSLYLGNLGIVFVFSIGGLVASLLFSSIQFAEYAFAYGFTSIVYISFDGLMTVLIPYLAQSGTNSLKEMTSEISIITLIWLSPIINWIGLIIIPKWLPQYIDAIPLIYIFTIALPFAAVIRTRIISASTAQGRERLLLTFSIISFLIAVFVIGICCLNSPNLSDVAVAWASVISMSAIIGGLFVAHKLAKGMKADIRIIANAVLSSLLFLIIGRSNVSFKNGIIYLLFAAMAILINWGGYRGKSKQFRLV